MTTKVFFKADEVAAVLGLRTKTVRNRAAKAGDGSVLAQCARGCWHRVQVRLMHAMRMARLTRESAEHRWTLVKCRVIESLPPERREEISAKHRHKGARIPARLIPDVPATTGPPATKRTRNRTRRKTLPTHDV